MPDQTVSYPSREGRRLEPFERAFGPPLFWRLRNGEVQDTERFDGTHHGSLTEKRSQKDRDAQGHDRHHSRRSHRNSHHTGHRRKPADRSQFQSESTAEIARQ